jgi:hypothetical protein
MVPILVDPTPEEFAKVLCYKRGSGCSFADLKMAD